MKLTDKVPIHARYFSNINNIPCSLIQLFFKNRFTFKFIYCIVFLKIKISNITVQRHFGIKFVRRHWGSVPTLE